MRTRVFTGLIAVWLVAACSAEPGSGTSLTTTVDVAASSLPAPSTSTSRGEEHDGVSGGEGPKTTIVDIGYNIEIEVPVSSGLDQVVHPSELFLSSEENLCAFVEAKIPAVTDLLGLELDDVHDVFLGSPNDEENLGERRDPAGFCYLDYAAGPPLPPGVVVLRLDPPHPSWEEFSTNPCLAEAADRIRWPVEADADDWSAESLLLVVTKDTFSVRICSWSDEFIVHVEVRHLDEMGFGPDHEAEALAYEVYRTIVGE